MSGTTGAVNATRWFGLIVTIVTLAAVAWPLRRDPVRDDSFPLSTYPMFAARRPGAKLYLEYLVATGPDGARRHVPPRLITKAEVMQAIMTVKQAIGRGDAKGLCTRTAAKLARDRGFDRLDTLAVIAGNHAAVDYLVRHVHGPERTLVSCPIPRGSR